MFFGLVSAVCFFGRQTIFNKMPPTHALLRSVCALTPSLGSSLGLAAGLGAVPSCLLRRGILSKEFGTAAGNAGSEGVRTDWTREEVKEVYEMPFLELIHRAAGVHRRYNDPSMVQYVS